MLLGEAPANPLELINFREGEFAYHGTGGVAGALRRTAILAGVALASAVLCFLLSVSVNGRQLRVLNREISTTVSPALGEVDPAAAKSLLSAKIAATRKRLHMMGGNLGHGSPLDLLLSLSRAIPVGLPVEVNELQVDESGMKLEGNADSFATVDQVKRALERSRRFSAITVEHAAAGSDPSKVEFRMSMTANEAGDY
jgi:hypothetical protein